MGIHLCSIFWTFYCYYQACSSVRSQRFRVCDVCTQLKWKIQTFNNHLSQQLWCCLIFHTSCRLWSGTAHLGGLPDAGSELRDAARGGAGRNTDKKCQTRCGSAVCRARPARQGSTDVARRGGAGRSIQEVNSPCARRGGVIQRRVTFASGTIDH